jgi:hypothetical protein
MARPSPQNDSVGRVGGIVDRAATTQLAFFEAEGVTTVAGVDAPAKAGRLATSEICSTFALTNGQSGATAAAMLLAASALARRRFVVVTNWHATATLYVGRTSAVTASGATRGIEVPPRTYIIRPWGPAVDIYGIASGAATDWQIEEGD